MNKTSKIGLTAAALMACASGASAATVTITQTLSFGPSKTAWSHTFSFAPFNPLLGTLVKVSDTITENLAGTIDITNEGISSATYTASLSDTAHKMFSGLTTLTTTISNTVSSPPPLTPFGTPGDTTGPLALFGTSTGSATTTSALADFEGASLVATAKDVGSLNFHSDTANALATFDGTGQVIDKLVYTYTTKTPEPGTLALIGSALAGLAMFRRRKRK